MCAFYTFIVFAYWVLVCLLVLVSVREVRECFTTQLMVFAEEGFFSCVAAVVDFQVFKAGKTALTSISLSIGTMLLSIIL